MNFFCMIAFILFSIFVTPMLAQTIPQGTQQQLPSIGIGDAHLSTLSELVQDSKAVSENELQHEVFRCIVQKLVAEDRVAAVKKLIDVGVNIKFVDRDQNSLLHIAINHRADNVARMLIDAGLQVDMKNRNQRTPLFIAAINGDHELAGILLERGAKVNGMPKHAPLNAAAWYGHTEVVKLLLEHNADVGRRDVDGNTPLHKAVWQNQVECVELLLAAGAERSRKNRAGLTPLSLAQSNLKTEKSSKIAFRAWGPEQITGAPDAGNGYSEKEWCPSATGKQEWIQLRYAELIRPGAVQLFSKPTPALVKKISFIDQQQNEHVVWDRDKLAKGTTLTPDAPTTPHIATIKLADNRIKTKQVKIYTDGTTHNGWIYLDALGIRDQAGKMHWGQTATASSTYASGPQPRKKATEIMQLLVGQKSN
ncbi:MAG: ankyrin repeat domain-containing protein [Planctomycetota bacterium]